MPVSEIRKKYEDFDVRTLIHIYNRYRYVEIKKGVWVENPKMTAEQAIQKACADLAKVISKEDCERIPMVNGGKSKKTLR